LPSSWTFSYAALCSSFALPLSPPARQPHQATANNSVLRSVCAVHARGLLSAFSFRCGRRARLDDACAALTVCTHTHTLQCDLDSNRPLTVAFCSSVGRLITPITRLHFTTTAASSPCSSSTPPPSSSPGSKQTTHQLFPFRLGSSVSFVSRSLGLVNSSCARASYCAVSICSMVFCGFVLCVSHDS
jgi:hypothetical protein